MKAILMHSREKCQLNVWLLSGTGDGPVLAKAFLKKGWKVSVSVVSPQASLAYIGLDLDELFIGPLNGVDGICSILKKTHEEKRNFDYVIDATHPFATIITDNLTIACKKLNQNFIRFERPVENIQNAKLIKDINQLEQFDLRGQRLLFAIGSRSLNSAVSSAKASGAISFARVLPTVEGLLKSLSLTMPQENIAVLKPLKGNPPGSIEEALCRRWKISGVVCRESGGLNQKVWQAICNRRKLDLWLISRPQSPSGIENVYSVNELINKMSYRYS